MAKFVGINDRTFVNFDNIVLIQLHNPYPVKKGDKPFYLFFTTVSQQKIWVGFDSVESREAALNMLMKGGVLDVPEADKEVDDKRGKEDSHL